MHQVYEDAVGEEAADRIGVPLSTWESCLQESTCLTPIFFVLFPGWGLSSTCFADVLVLVGESAPFGTWGG